MRQFNSMACIVCRRTLYSLPGLAEEMQEAPENQFEGADAIMRGHRFEFEIKKSLYERIRPLRAV